MKSWESFRLGQIWVCLGVIGAVVSSASADDATTTEQRSVKASQLQSILEEGLGRIKDPASYSPYDEDLQTEEYWRFYETFTEENLLNMDDEVKRYIFDAIQRGQTIEGLSSVETDGVSWFMWPKALDYSEVIRMYGVTDRQATDYEWMAMENAVIVIYSKFDSSSGVTVYILQNSFRTRAKDNVRECPSLYTIIDMGDGEFYLTDLYMRQLLNPAGPGSFSAVPRILGFLMLEGESLPTVLTSRGPDGRLRAFDVSQYRWNESAKVWEGSSFWVGESVLTYTYDAESCVFTYYMCYVPNPSGEGPNVPSCPEVVDFRQQYDERGDEIEVLRRDGVRRHSELNPPLAKYKTEQAPSN